MDYKVWIKRIIRDAMDYMTLVSILLLFKVVRNESARGHQALIRLHSRYGSHINDHLSKFFAKGYKKAKLSSLCTVLNWGEGDTSSGYRELLVDGYCYRTSLLPNGSIMALRQFAEITAAIPRPMAGKVVALSPPSSLYVRGCPQAVIYDYRRGDLIRLPDVQNLICDGGILDVAQKYLNALPILNAVSMWWQTDLLKNPDAEAAQFYHYDMDGIKWIKIFIYLTEVTETTGPHTFIRGSHIAGNIPHEILRLGYSRLPDQMIAELYSNEDVKEFVGSEGTVIIEDTRGLHKAKHVQRGDRLILQLQYSSSLFGMLGANYQPVKLPIHLTDNLRTAMKKYPKIFKEFFTV